MKGIVFSVLLLVLPGTSSAEDGERHCVAWAQQIVGGTGGACSDLCPQARKFDGYDYRKGLREAFASIGGLDRYLAYLGRSSIMGAGAEAHACSVQALLVHWGDKRFSQALAKQPGNVKEEALGLLDYTALTEFPSRFPKTYRLGAHQEVSRP